MGQHKLNLSEEKRLAERKRFNELKRLAIPKPRYLIVSKKKLRDVPRGTDK